MPTSTLRHICFRFCLLLMILGSASFSSTAQIPVPQARVTQPIDEKRSVALPGNVHPLARAEFDRGPAPLDLKLNRMLLVLKRAPEQEVALRKLLDEQQDKFSPNYHAWLTPDQFGQRFGPADTDIEAITQWLSSQGFTDIRVANGRTAVEFSGNSTQVHAAFHTEIHRYLLPDGEHFANSTDPQIPSALSPVVEGVFTLHNFFKQPLVHVVENQVTTSVAQGSHPLFTSSGGAHALTPFDYYKIYNFDPTQPYGPVSERIAIVARSNINLQDVGYFNF